MKAQPEPGVLIISPIEEPNEKHFIEIVGQNTNLTWAVIEKSNPTVRKNLTPGALVAYRKPDAQDIPLEQGVLFKLLLETSVLLTIPASEVDNVVRKNMSPEQIRGVIDKRQADAEAANRRAELAASVAGAN